MQAFSALQFLGTSATNRQNSPSSFIFPSHHLFLSFFQPNLIAGIYPANPEVVTLARTSWDWLPQCTQLSSSQSLYYIANHNEQIKPTKLDSRLCFPKVIPHRIACLWSFTSTWFRTTTELIVWYRFLTRSVKTQQQHIRGKSCLVLVTHASPSLL